jgi:two-component system cell cycle sensor histidine kinase/response regulator CckA
LAVGFLKDTTGHLDSRIIMMPAPHEGHRPQILVIDDEPRILQFVSAAFSQSDYDVSWAYGGGEGLRLAEEMLPDVILLDVMMPGENGFSICRKLRSHALLASIPIIMITALSDRQSRLQGIEAGADEFITKPIDVAELRARVKVVVRLNRFRKQLEQQRQFTRLVNLAPDSILVLDRTLNIRFANRSASRLFRCSPELDLLETSFPMILLTDEEAVSKRLVELAGSENTDRLSGLNMLRLDGGEIVADISAGPFHWDNRPALLLMIRDVSEQRLLERQLQRLQRLDSLGAVAASVAHDLNNVMTPILLAAQALEGATTADSNRAITRTIIEAARHGSDVVEQILAFTRGRNEREPRDLREVITATLALHAMSGTGVEKQIELEENVGNVAAASDLQQALGNLITNAIEAMTQGGVLRVRLTRADAATARIEIADSGPGMDESTLQRLGEPLFTTKPDGTGLGFSTASAIIRRLGGDLCVESSPGTGTTVTMTLPTHASDTTAAQSTAEMIDLTGVTVVLAEADEAVRLLTAQTMECFGALVLQADTSKRLDQFTSQQAVVDLLLCGHSFLADAETFVQNELFRLNPRAQVILVGSASNTTGTPADFFKLPKPYGRQELVRALRLALTAAGRTEEPVREAIYD